MSKMISHSSHAGFAAATGLASRGNRSSIDAGKRNSLTRERAFAELKIIHRRSGGMVQRDNGLNRSVLYNCIKSIFIYCDGLEYILNTTYVNDKKLLRHEI